MNLAGMSRTSGGVQKVCANKVRVHFSFPSEGGEPSIRKLFKNLATIRLCLTGGLLTGGFRN